MITYPDPLPFKLRVLRALTDALKEITPAAGYVFNLADFDDSGVMQARVFRGRAWFGDNDPIPLVSVLEGVSPADDVAEPHLKTEGGSYDWPIMVQGFVDDDPENPTDPAYVLMADVRRRLVVEKTRKLPNSAGQLNPFGMGEPGPNRVTGLIIGPGVVRPADDVSSKAYFWLSLTLRIVDNAAEPYS